MATRLFLAGGILVLAGLSPAVSDAAQVRSAGTLRFHVTVGGKAHDSGTIVAPIGMVSNPAAGDDFNGCAIVKQKAAAEVLGAQTFEIHFNYMGGTNLLAVGVHPFVAQEVYLQVMGYRPSVTSYPDASARPVDLSFAINGRVYGAPVHATAQIRNGGRDGSLSGPDAQRFYPGTIGHALHGVTFQAAWHCTSVLNQTAQF